MRRLLFALLAVALALALLEVAARLLPEPGAPGGAGDALRFDRNPELQEGNARYWAPDPELFWRMRPDLEVDFGGMPLATNAGGFRDHPHERRPGARLVAVAGDSSVFGWGVADPARRFPDRLEAMLTDSGSPVQVFNFGQSGYSTVQGRRLLEAEILPLRPDVVIFLYGANDYGEASGRSDADQPVAAAGGGVARAQGWLRHSALYRRLAATLVRARDAASDAAGGPGPDGVLRRVPLPGLAANLEAMVAAVRAAGGTPILMTYPRRPLHPVLPCPLPPPEDRDARHRRDTEIRRLAAALEPAVAAVRAAPATPPDAALAAWDRLPPDIRRSASGLYGEAWIRQRAGDTATADRLLAAAAGAVAPGECALDLFSLRAFRYLEEPAARATNRVIRQVAAGSGVVLVDAADLLAHAQEALLGPGPGGGMPPTRALARWFGPDSYFVDVVHPSARGHALLAEALSGPVLDALRP